MKATDGHASVAAIRLHQPFRVCHVTPIFNGRAQICARRKMDDESQQALDPWADQIAALEPEVRNGILARALRMAASRRLRKADREFAQAQAEAIGRALMRAKSGKRTARKR